mgnify:CR=1 FL=1
MGVDCIFCNAKADITFRGKRICIGCLEELRKLIVEYLQYLAKKFDKGNQDNSGEKEFR